MGGGKGGGSQTQTSEPWGASQPYLKDIMGQAQMEYRSGGPQYYPGQTFTGPTQGQIGAWDTALGYADQVFGGQQAPQFGKATGALNSALEGGQMGQVAGGNSQAAGTALGSMLSGQPDYSGLQASIDAANAPIMRQFEQEYLPQLNQRATFLGNPTGGIKSLNKVLPEMGQRMSENAMLATEGERQRALQSQQAGLGMYGQMAQGATQAQLAGAGLFPTIAQTGQYPGQLQEQFANWGAGYQQQQLDDQMARWNFEQNAPWANLNQYNSIVQGFGGMGGSATMPGGSNSSGALGGAIAGAQLGGQYGGGWGALLGGVGGGLLGSDRRMKRDITEVGKLDSGLKVYRYRYLWDETYHIGVMADEAREVFPDAVIRGADGFDRVDYSQIE
jgi:hypothetical protein